MSKAATDTKGEQADVRIETGGDLFRSLTDLLDILVDECKIRFSPDGADEPTVSVAAVDPANVGMVDLSVPKAAFEVYEVPDGSTVGLNLSNLTGITDYARKGGNSRDNPGDPVIVEKVGKRVYARVEPEDKWNRTGSFFQIDPNSIREEPDLPDLTLPWEGRMDAANFRDAMVGVNSRGFDHVALAPVVENSGNGSLGDGEDAYLSVYATNKDEGEVEDEFRSDEKILHADDGEDEVTSLYSLDHIKDMSEAIVSAGFDKVGVELGDEFPIKLRFGGSRWGIHGTYMLAPRIRSDTDSRATDPGSLSWGDRFETNDDDADEEED